MKKFCVKCGKPFDAIGREVICPSCKAQAAEETKRVAVERAKRASWNGESVPVRISGRASTVIRRYAAAHDVPFAESLDELLKSTEYFKGTGSKWGDITPYKSRRRDKSKTEDVQDAPTEAQASASKPAKQAAKKAVKTTSKGGKA